MELPTLTFLAGSYRDRTARVFVHERQIYRALDAEAAGYWAEVSQSSFFTELSSQQKLVETREVADDQRATLGVPADVATVLWHERVPFIAYPYEWCFGMLKDAALLHLEILAAALRDGFILKDATPYNIQFVGRKPVFIDIGSFTKLTPGEPWTAYQQFCELFLCPLLVQAHRGIDFQLVLRSELEGLGAEDVSRWFSWRDWWRSGVFSHVILHALLAKVTKKQTRSTLNELQKTGFPVSLILKNVERLTQLIQKLKWEPPQSMWSDYDQSSPMVARDADAKADFVRETAQERRWELVWDLGCNRGRYSLIAAEFAQCVLAMDSDHQCVEWLYRQLREHGPNNVVPLRINLANQSPALGWRGRERLRLEDRGQPDLILCLGLIHHLVIAANIPLAEVVDWLASFHATLVIEFPTKNDPMVQALLRNKRDQYHDYSQAHFESLLADRFRIDQRLALPSGERFLYRVIPLTETRAHDGLR